MTPLPSSTQVYPVAMARRTFPFGDNNVERSWRETFMTNKIVAILGSEILDSRGYPTLRVEVRLQDGTKSFASVPSGASTGEGEAHELRDGDTKRYGGRGVLKAAANLAEIGSILRGRDPTQQDEIDRLMIEADGTATKSRLGANAIVGTSMAVARAGATVSNLPLYAYLATSSSYQMPVPMMNVINGGVHAANNLDFQEYMIVPHGAPSFREGLRWGAETYHALRTLLHERGLSTGVGDEGGFAPDLENNESACALVVEAIQRAGYTPGEDISIALDPAASSFWRDGCYRLEKSGEGTVSSNDLRSLYATWTKRFPIVSIEDGFGEHDWAGFQAQCAELGKSIQLVGDDLYVTDPKLIGRGIAEKTTNAALIKLNQVGSVTETIAAIAACRGANWNYIVSHRSGETDDAFIADFAVAMSGGQIKAGAPCRGERLAKYNRLLDIEHELGNYGHYKNPFGDFRRRSKEVALTGEISTNSENEIIAVIEEASTARRCLTVAEQAARLASPMSLSALHICVDPAKMIAPPEEIDLQWLRVSHEGSAQLRLRQAHLAFENWTAHSGAEVKWREHVGDVTSSLVAEIKGAALIVVAQPHNLDSVDVLHAALFNTGRPVLFVPTRGPLLSPLSAHILVAWKSTPQARRAITHTLPWLRAAKHVTVVSVNEAKIPQASVEGIRILEDQGISADIRHARTDRGEHIADRLLAEAEEIGASAIVMGAYHFGEVVEYVFGGVTREILHRTRIPVFMTH